MDKPVILNVDDERYVLETLQEQLNRHFGEEYEVEIAQSGEEAIEMLNEYAQCKRQVPVVISDQIMPGIKGDDVLNAAKKLHPYCMTLMLTGQASPEAIGNAVNKAALYRFIAKPWDEDDLVLSVKNALTRYTDQKELNALHHQLEEFNQALKRFVPAGLVETLGHENASQIHLGDHIKKVMTLCVSDLRDCRNITKDMPPENEFQFINNYFNHMGPLIRKHKGIIDRYVGDAIHSLFDQAESAVQAAVDMINMVRKLPFLPKEVSDQIDLGIGIHTGEVLLGMVGESEHLNGAVISSVVNFASLLERLTKDYGVNLLISETTFNKLSKPSKFNIRLLDRVQVKETGKNLDILEVLDAEDETLREGKLKTLKFFEEAVSLYHQHKYPSARDLFMECLQLTPADSASRKYYQRCMHYIKVGESNSWQVRGVLHGS